MIRLVVKNKFVSLKGSSTVKDENDEPRFQVDGKFLSLRRKKFVKTLDGTLLYRVQNKFFTFIFHKCYVYDAQDNLVAFVKQRFKLIGDKFKVESPQGDLEIQGDVINRNFTVVRGGVPIGEIKQHLITLRDGFTITAFDDKDASFLVALVIAIDNIYDKNNS